MLKSLDFFVAIDNLPQIIGEDDRHHQKKNMTNCDRNRVSRKIYSLIRQHILKNPFGMLADIDPSCRISTAFRVPA